ncbi:MAG: hypothetical protein KatS3mg077_1509 [Candidatus Binatia bacterium]|nr:MAG: hypothetical protein KatS3mg015_2596 [Fimbriimonadales bacterium]GIW44227.1 MAG: hypothetical protein KatS3mg077_1509 [Candidatus Binatia bacterium]
MCPEARSAGANVGVSVSPPERAGPAESVSPRARFIQAAWGVKLFLQRVLRLALRSRTASWEFVGPSGCEPISVPLVGVGYEPRTKLARSVKLRDRVWLWREPSNPHDPNAVACIDGQGCTLGYLSRHLAAEMAPYMDRGANPIEAVVTELSTDVHGALLGVRVGFYVPEALVELIRAARPQLSYCFEVGQAGTRYLSLDCDEPTLHEVMGQLAARGHPCLRHGLSSRPASDGRQYRWYAAFESDLTEEFVRDFFARAFGVLTAEQQVRQEVQEWVEVYEEENEDLRAKLAEAKAELERERQHAEAILRDSQRKERELRRAQREELPKFLGLFAPQLHFVRDSVDVLAMELASHDDLLRKLAALATAPQEVRARRVQMAPDWSELHFSTGRADDGRLYFRRAGNRWQVLVSFKGQQSRDLQYLKTFKG